MLYLLKKVYLPEYDETAGFVIRAKNEKEAREIAADHHTGTYPHVWTDTTQTTCTPIPRRGIPEVILEDYKAG